VNSLLLTLDVLTLQLCIIITLCERLVEFALAGARGTASHARSAVELMVK
jgi:hypothetical protein